MVVSSDRTAACTQSPALPSKKASPSPSRRISASSVQASSSRLTRRLLSQSAARWNNSSICAQRSGVNLHLSTLQFFEKPRFRHSQVAPNSNSRHIQALCDLIHGEPGKIAELDDL